MSESAASPFPVRCLLVDDDPGIRELLTGFLQPFGMRLEAVADGNGMRRRLPASDIDVLLLDVMLPGESGLDLCQWVKREQPGLPVIMLTAQGDTLSRVLGLELGADDYLPKPFEPRELVARIRAVLRSTTGSVAPAQAMTRVRIGAWSFDRVQRRLYDPEGVMVPLSAAEYRLLVAFVDHPDVALSRDRLLELTRAPGVDANERSIDLAVSRLRSKLGEPDAQNGMIRTLRGTGYLFAPRRAT
jgi:two-component system, OmpR family, response regulator